MNISLRQILLAALLVAASVYAYSRSPSHWAVDFYNYWIVAQSVHTNSNIDIYDPVVEQELKSRWGTVLSGSVDERVAATARLRGQIGLYLTASPLLYAVQSTFIGEDFSRDFTIYRVLQLLIFIGSCMFLLNRLGVDWPRILLTLSLLLLAFRPLHTDLNVGNGNEFILLGAVLVFQLLSGGRFALAGAVIGFAVLFKANFLWVPSVVWMSWVKRREWSHMYSTFWGGLLGAVAGLGISLFFWSSFRPWVSWLTGVFPHLIRREDFFTGGGNAALLQLTAEATGAGQLTLGLIFAAVWLACSYFLFTPSRRRENHAYLVAMGCMGMLLVPKLVWFHYEIMAAPALLILSTGLEKAKPSYLGLVAVLMAGLSIGSNGILGDRVLWAVVNSCCLIGLTAAVVVQERSRTPVESLGSER